MAGGNSSDTYNVVTFFIKLFCNIDGSLSYFNDWYFTDLGLGQMMGCLGIKSEFL